MKRVRSGMPAEDLGQRVGDGGDLGGVRVDVQGGPDRDVAEVVGPETAGTTTTRLSGAPL